MTETPSIATPELREHLERMAASADVLSLPDLLHRHAVSCVDGRKADCVVGAPGGNAGLFILMLAAYESATSKTLSSHEIPALLGAYLKEFGHFYMHTDDLALENLREALRTQPDTRGFVRGFTSPAALETWLRCPPVEAHSALLKLLVVPDHVGCGHLRLMLERPGEYGVRAELVRAVVKAFYRRLWAGDERLVLDVLEGVHDEKAVVVIHVERESGPTPERGSGPALDRESDRKSGSALDRESDRESGSALDGKSDRKSDRELALACPRFEETDVFVFHPEAAAYLARSNAEFLVHQGMMDADGVEQFTRVQTDLGTEQLSATLKHLAPDIPVYDVTFAVDGKHISVRDVRSAG